MIAELKKIFGRKGLFGIFICTILLSMVLSIFCINTYKYQDGNGKIYVGKMAIDKEEKDSLTEGSLLNQKKVDNFFDEYKTTKMNSKKKERFFEKKYPVMYWLLYNTYELDGADMLYDMKNYSKFYNVLEKNYKKNEFVKEHKLSAKDISDSQQFYKNVKKPFLNKGIALWAIILKIVFMLQLFMVLISILASCRIYSIEKETNMEMIVKPQLKKKRSFISKRIVAILLLILIVSITAYGTIFCVIFAMGEGTNLIKTASTSVQMLPDFLFCYYDDTVATYTLRGILIGILSILGGASFCMMCDAIFQNRNISILVSLIVLFMLIELNMKGIDNGLVYKIVSFMPISGVNPVSLGVSSYVISIGKLVVTQYEGIAIINIVFILISILGIEKIYVKR